MLFQLIKQIARSTLFSSGKHAGEDAKLEAACRQALKSIPYFGGAYNQLGVALVRQGRDAEAEEAFSSAILLERGQGSAQFNLARIFHKTQRFDEAEAMYLRAIETFPDFAEAYNALGSLLADQERLADAEHAFLSAIRLRPDYEEALANLQNVRDALADSPSRRQQRPPTGSVGVDKPRAGHSVFVETAPESVRRVLLLMTQSNGNVPYEFLFPATITTRVKWVMEFATNARNDKLPPYDLAFYAMGDPDVTGDTERPVAAFLKDNRKPLLNAPDKVARTARNRLPQLLEGIEGVHVPPVWRFGTKNAWDARALELPQLLIRPVHTHGGVDLQLVDTPEKIRHARETQKGAVFVTSFVDYRAADSFYRKYRIIFVDRTPYPYHLAISPSWMAHYYTADMPGHAWKLEEEKRFLQDPETVFGAKGMAALREIGRRLDLDYAGIDFSVLADGTLLVFEANPTMGVYYEPILGPTEHKNVFIKRIYDAFEALLERKLG